jgi:hypothetical protein
LPKILLPGFTVPDINLDPNPADTLRDKIEELKVRA